MTYPSDLSIGKKVFLRSLKDRKPYLVKIIRNADEWGMVKIEFSNGEKEFRSTDNLYKTWGEAAAIAPLREPKE